MNKTFIQDDACICTDQGMNTLYNNAVAQSQGEYSGVLVTWEVRRPFWV